MPASAREDADRTNNWRLVNDFFARIVVAILAPSSNHDGGCPLNLTPGRSFYDGGVTRNDGRIRSSASNSDDGVSYRFQLQMPPDLQGQT